MKSDNPLQTIRTPKGPVPQAPKTTIDWRGYFMAFCDLHGPFPFTYKGRLLFEDGWTYSATDYRGPEWPPPEDYEEHVRLVRSYWNLRRAAGKRDLSEAKERLMNLKNLVVNRSADVPQVTRYTDPDTGKMTEVRAVADVTGMEKRIVWLEEDIALSEEEMVGCTAELRLMKLERRPRTETTSGKKPSTTTPAA